MSFYRNAIAAIAAIGLTTTVFAAEEMNQSMQPASNDSIQAMHSEANAEQTKVDLNKATVKELMKVKGMNSAKANAIVKYRKKHGDFKSLDELKEVKGFKNMNGKAMEEMQEHLTVG